MKFVKAEKRKSKLRLALIGPSGSGKTYSALAIAAGLGKRIAVIDTERGSASLYADRFPFDVLELETFEPATYVDALRSAAAEGYDVIVIDSLSHAWMGKGGALEQVDTAAKRSRTGSTFNAWREVTPQHNAFVDAMLQSPAHVIATMRAKTEYVLEEGHNGKKVPRKIGMAPIQRDGLEYEFTVVGDLDYEHNFIVSKTRCSDLAGKVVAKPGSNIADTLKAWLESGAAELPRPVVVAPVAVVPAPAPAVEPAPDAEPPTRMELELLCSTLLNGIEEVENAFHFANWKRKHRGEIDSLKQYAADLWQRVIDSGKAKAVELEAIAKAGNGAAPGPEAA